jgi:hypothetical protein
MWYAGKRGEIQKAEAGTRRAKRPLEDIYLDGMTILKWILDT